MAVCVRAGVQALAPLASALVDFLRALPTARGEVLMREEEVMLRAITRAQHDTDAAEHADADEVPPAVSISTPR